MCPQTLLIVLVFTVSSRHEERRRSEGCVWDCGATEWLQRYTLRVSGVYWWKVRWERLTETNQGGLWTTVRSLSLTGCRGTM